MKQKTPRALRIAQIAPNWGNFIEEKAYGIMAVVRDVTRTLSARGHQVTVFASDDSVFPGQTLEMMGPSLKSLGRSIFNPESDTLQHAYAERILPKLYGFDIVHSHIEHILLPYLAKISVPVVSTIHGASFAPKEQQVFEMYPDGVFIALSERAKHSLPFIHFSGVVYNGIEVAACPFFQTIQPPGYLAWMGRFAENKGALTAIETAKRVHEVLTLVGIEQASEKAYYRRIEKEADGAMIRVIDRMLGKVKYDFLGNAKALLFPIHWDEPFGLVMIEAMACGTPVIAYNRGSVPEIVKDGVTGFIVEPPEKDIKQDKKRFNLLTSGKKVKPFQAEHPWIIKKRGVEGLVEAVKRIGEIDRAACRRHVEENFTVEKMVEGYERVYEQILA